MLVDGDVPSECIFTIADVNAYGQCDIGYNPLLSKEPYISMRVTRWR